jgi:hypothetical protein
MPLDEAVQRALGVYEKEQRHPAPTDVVAKHLGYKSANSGSALAAIASMTSYGLLERPSAGKLAVSPDVQSFQYAPDDTLKKGILKKWLRAPSIFAELLDRYEGRLPSDATIRYDLIQQGFQPSTAESVLKSFKRSIEYAEYYDTYGTDTHEEEAGPPLEEQRGDRRHPTPVDSPTATGELKVDRIPVRLDAERRAWLEIPTPFYEADKRRLKAQIDILLTDNESEQGGPEREA